MKTKSKSLFGKDDKHLQKDSKQSLSKYNKTIIYPENNL